MGVCASKRDKGRVEGSCHVRVRVVALGDACALYAQTGAVHAYDCMGLMTRSMVDIISESSQLMKYEILSCEIKGSTKTILQRCIRYFR